ncbi:MAG TPA: DUF3291 domain-containing protein [Candidatus Acidoferrales bacterium]|nr:DUF3291 domain-containing protein [Candidatus Acidoferrales bacterium]
MPLISVTRLRIRSFVYLPQFVWHTFQATRQAQRAPGFVGGKLMREAGNVFWTLTAWQEGAAMSAFRIRGAHGGVMPRLLDWCDEASVAHWHQESGEIPSWIDAHQRLLTLGRPSKVKHPTAAHLAHQIPVPRPGRIQGPLERLNSS